MNRGGPNNFISIVEVDQPVGYYSLSEPDNNGDRYFTQVYVDEPMRRQGIATRTYIQVARELNRNGQQLVSDSDSFSTGALAVWNALQRQGLASSTGQPETDSLEDVRGVAFRAIIPDR
jgi:GNAT superfamily N-acetyltransferase